jgi:ankyrin repeat protein
MYPFVRICKECVQKMDHAKAFFLGIYSGSVDVLEEVIDLRPGAVDWVDHRGATAILCAAEARQTNVIATLLRRGAKLGVFEAVAVGDEALAKKLISEDPGSVDLFCATGASLLHLAVGSGNASLCSAIAVSTNLLDAEATDGRGLTPLKLAIVLRDLECVRTIVAAGADTDAAGTGINKRPPLHLAASLGLTEVASVLLAGGAKRDLIWNEGDYIEGTTIRRGRNFTAADLARLRGYTKIVKILSDTSTEGD